ncbi:hypothetical protein MTBUT4_440041 [Magnetospirillum sp. UT-4]|nr:hypothetical protein MTBUT4_440041 [Magnetospirillum sp. UT-4]
MKLTRNEPSDCSSDNITTNTPA